VPKDALLYLGVHSRPTSIGLPRVPKVMETRMGVQPSFD
jgi:hypothetical protein